MNRARAEMMIKTLINSAIFMSHCFFLVEGKVWEQSNGVRGCEVKLFD